MATFSKKLNGPWEKYTTKKNGLFRQDVHSVFTSRSQIKCSLRRGNVIVQHTPSLQGEMFHLLKPD